MPWAIIGHATVDRSILLAAASQLLGSDGFAFMPPIRPYNKGSGFEEAEIFAVLRKSQIYLWGSHHSAPYHEGLRALHAVRCGCIPAKIDPIYHHEFTGIPWVYSSVDALKVELQRRGGPALFSDALGYVVSRGTLGSNFMQALQRLEIA